MKIAYKVVPLQVLSASTLQSLLNNEGTSGWDLVDITRVEPTPQYLVTFKKEVAGEPLPFEDLPPIEQVLAPITPVVDSKPIQTTVFPPEPPPPPEPEKEDPDQALYEEGWLPDEKGGWQDPLATEEQLVSKPFGRYTRDEAIRIIGARTQSAN